MAMDVKEKRLSSFLMVGSVGHHVVDKKIYPIGLEW